MMDSKINVFNEIVALQVYQNSKNYDQIDPDLSGLEKLTLKNSILYYVFAISVMELILRFFPTTYNTKIKIYMFYF